jgi:hypothetical protein
MERANGEGVNGVVDDDGLVREIQRGSEAAMEVLTRRYYQMIFAFVYRKTGDRELAADLTQEIFIKMIKKSPLTRKKDRSEAGCSRLPSTIAGITGGAGRTECPSGKPRCPGI